MLEGEVKWIDYYTCSVDLIGFKTGPLPGQSYSSTQKGGKGDRGTHRKSVRLSIIYQYNDVDSKLYVRFNVCFDLTFIINSVTSLYCLSNY